MHEGVPYGDWGYSLCEDSENFYDGQKLPLATFLEGQNLPCFLIPFLLEVNATVSEGRPRAGPTRLLRTFVSAGKMPTPRKVDG